MSDCIYRDSDWGEEFRAHLEAPIRYLPADWAHRVALEPPPSPPEQAKECEALLALKDRRNEHRAAIEREAQTRRDAIDGVLGQVNLFLPPRVHTLNLVFAVLDEILAPTFATKLAFKRGRPGACCGQAVEPMFQGTVLDPHHPAYPSGHSTQSHAVAMVLAELVPGAANSLMAAAGQTALNREIAGLHYPSDSAAGARLARRLLDLLLANDAFVSEWMAPARKEWP